MLGGSEIAQRKLDAEWVVPLPCNTVAADGTPGAEGLAGLAKAFFYSGSRALLATHWSVGFEAMQELMALLFAGQAEHEAGRAEALR